jgi:hypothetical protein
MKEAIQIIADHQLIEQIAMRAASLYERITGTKPEPAYIASELHMVHREIVPLDLQRLLDADDGNFAHDIGGIHRHLEIGNPCKLSSGFMPRFAVCGRERS